MKYPRTPHIFWSGNRKADQESMDMRRSIEMISSDGLVIEEKLDGANCSISFLDGRPVVRSRGHELSGGEHPQWDPIMPWIYSHRHRPLMDALGERYVMYGEWMYARHNMEYESLPDYFHEFDIYDKHTGYWLSTKLRHELLSGCDVVSVPVIATGRHRPEQVSAMLTRMSAYDATKNGVPVQIEGVYLKLESDGQTIGRAKWVRDSFTREVTDSEHWSKHDVVPNRLKG